MPEVMELPVKALPSKGYGYKFNLIRIPQMVYSKIIDYQGELESSNNELSTLLCQLKHILLPLENGKNISMYDAIPLIAIRSYSSTNDKLTDYIKIRYMCPVHLKHETLEVKMKNLTFEDMDPMLKKIKSIKINKNSYTFRIPTVEEFIKVANDYKTVLPVKNAVRFVWTLSMFKDIENKDVASRLFYDVTNATDKDIKALDYVYEMLSGSFKYFKATCKNGGEPVVVKIPVISPITDIFQNIRETEEFDKTSFEYRENDEN